MKRYLIVTSLLLIGLVCNAHSFQTRNNFLVERNYYNPAANFLTDGSYLKTYSMYEFDIPALAGRKPLDTNLDFYFNRPDYSVFASVSHDEYSYFKGHCLSAGYNHTFTFGGGNHILRVGGRFLLGFNHVDFSKLPYGDSGKAMLLSPDLDLGVEYQYRILHLGASVKNILSLGSRYEGVEYINWPRAYMLQAFVDVKLHGEDVMLYPFMTLGINQNMMFIVGTDLDIFHYVRLGYSFRVPDLHHNFNASVDICKRVAINVGYSFSTAHKFSALHAAILVKLSK